MAVTIYHKVINRVRIVNNAEPKPEKKMIKVTGDIKAKKHTITEERTYG